MSHVGPLGHAWNWGSGLSGFGIWKLALRAAFRCTKGGAEPVARVVVGGTKGR